MGDSAADPKPTQIPAINRSRQLTETDPEETVENKLKRCNFVQAREEEEVAAYKRSMERGLRDRRSRVVLPVLPKLYQRPSGRPA